MTSHSLCCFVLGSGIMAASALTAHADTVFRDTFRDGDAQDGVPVTWTLRPGEQLAVDSGKLVISDSDGFSLAAVRDLSLADTSIRTRLRIAAGDAIGVTARWNPGGSSSGYYGYVLASGAAGIGVANTSDILDSIPSSGVQPSQEDVMMQLDVIDGQIGLWVWPVEEAMPADPLATATATIGSLATGDIYVWVGFADLRNQPVDGIFSFVHVADMHIPEPSTLVLAGLSCVGLIALRWVPGNLLRFRV